MLFLACVCRLIIEPFKPVNDNCVVVTCLVSVVAKDWHCFRLHRILYNVLHSNDCGWIPSSLSIARVFVNYGTCHILSSVLT